MHSSSTNGDLCDTSWFKACDGWDVSSRIFLAANQLVTSKNAHTRRLGHTPVGSCEHIIEICDAYTKSHLRKCEISVNDTLAKLVDRATFAAGPNTRLHLSVGHDAEFRRASSEVFRILANLVITPATLVNKPGRWSMVTRSTERGGKPTLSLENSSFAEGRLCAKDSDLCLLIAPELDNDICTTLIQVCDGCEGAVCSLELPDCMLVSNGDEQTRAAGA